MKVSILWAVGIGITLVLVFHSFGYAEAAKREPKYLDLYTPFEKIGRKLGNFQRNFNLGNLIKALNFIINECIIGTKGQHSAQSQLLLNEIEAGINNLILKHENEIGAVIQAGFNETCQKDWFKEVHMFIWRDDEHKSMTDIVHFFSRFGYGLAFMLVKGIYQLNKCPQELIDVMPDGPELPSDLQNLDFLHETAACPPTYNEQQANIQQIISTLTSSRQNPFADFELRCEITDLIKNIQNTGMVDLLILVQTLIEEVQQKPSLHFLMGKFQEPAKGKSFRGLRQLELIRQFFFTMNENLKYALECDGALLLTKIKEQTGIDLTETNIVELLLQLFELVFWLNLDPVCPAPIKSEAPPCSI